MPVPRITDVDRRRRLAIRHHLGTAHRATHPVAVAADLVGLHSSDPASVYLSAFARVDDFGSATLEDALYEARTLIRILGMRRTMFVLPVELAAIVQAACGPDNGARQRKATLGLLADAGITDDPERWLRDAEAETLAALDRLGQATGTELAAAVPRLREKVQVGLGKRWEGTIGLTTRVVFQLAAEGRIVRGRPRGSWLSSQYRWSRMSTWLGHDLPAVDPDRAREELLRRWLAAYGPATMADLRWWTGWTLGAVRRALAGIETAEVTLDQGTGLVLAHDLERDGHPTPEKPSAVLLPGLDPTVMGWTGRDWYLGGHRPMLFDTNGNAGPTIWWDGRVVGGWGQRVNGDIAIRLLEDVGADARAAIEHETERLAGWIGRVRVTPRFRTPVEQGLGT